MLTIHGFLKDILQFLRENKYATDSIEIRKYNILKEFQGHKNGVREDNKEVFISTTSFMRFLFYHYDQLKYACIRRNERKK